jgi:hypothetical protein
MVTDIPYYGVRINSSLLNLFNCLRSIVLSYFAPFYFTYGPAQHSVGALPLCLLTDVSFQYGHAFR